MKHLLCIAAAFAALLPTTFLIAQPAGLSGCTDPAACNFNPLALTDDGSCVTDEVSLTVTQPDCINPAGSAEVSYPGSQPEPLVNHHPAYTPYVDTSFDLYYWWIMIGMTDIWIYDLPSEAAEEGFVDFGDLYGLRFYPGDRIDFSYLFSSGDAIGFDLDGDGYFSAAEIQNDPTAWIKTIQIPDDTPPGTYTLRYVLSEDSTNPITDFAYVTGDHDLVLDFAVQVIPPPAIPAPVNPVCEPTHTLFPYGYGYFRLNQFIIQGSSGEAPEFFFNNPVDYDDLWSSNFYYNRTDKGPVLSPGENIQMTFKSDLASSYDDIHIVLWMDWNGDGILEDEERHVRDCTNNYCSFNSGWPFDWSIPVPGNVVTQQSIQGRLIMQEGIEAEDPCHFGVLHAEVLDFVAYIGSEEELSYAVEWSTGATTDAISLEASDSVSVTVSNPWCTHTLNVEAVTLVSGCMDASACNFNPAANCTGETCVFPEEHRDCEGTCLNDTDGDGVCDEEEVSGCTDALAVNYQAGLTDDDGSCIYEGCTYSQAVNFNPAASIENGSCLFEIESESPCSDGYVYNDFLGHCVPLCPEDLDFDGLISSGDLLNLLGVFAASCVE